MEATMQQISAPTNNKHRSKFISGPLFKQTFKSNWFLWVLLTLGGAAIFFIINIVIGSKNIFNSIDMDNVSVYVADQDMQWLQILGLLEQMGYKLSRIEVMSRIDLNAIINELVYKIAGVLLPMIYLMITANSLVASQVNSGSMAYVLSTPTNRKTVIRTTYIYLILALTSMYVVITCAALGSEAIANAAKASSGAKSSFLPLRTILYCLASFCAMFALAGCCFGASAFFNKTTHSIALGGGVCVVSFLCSILGLFGNQVFVSVGIGVEAMKIFDYASILTLIDTSSISNFTRALAGEDIASSLNWVWEIGILLGIGAITALIGAIRFNKKDLPL